MKNLYKIENELYIISDNENINENDYIITKDDRLVQVSYLLSKDLERASKVILTTNALLIKDGVQEIDDEFLEWFVKNPNCESVEVEIICGVCRVEGKEDDINVCGRSKECARGWISDKYKIIIPRKIIQTYEINDLKEAFLKGYVAKNNKEDYPFAVQKFLNSKLNENKK